MRTILIALFFFPIFIFSGVEEEFSDLETFYNKKEWSKVLYHTNSMIESYPLSIFINEIYYFQGVAYFYLDHLDLSNESLSKYLSNDGCARYFEDAIHYKYKIGDKFQNGYYGHLFGMKGFPRVESMWETAYEIYNEVIKTLPRSEIASRSLFSLGKMYKKDSKFGESVEAFSNLIRRFPNCSASQKAYIEIAKVYKKQLIEEYLDEKRYQLVLVNQQNFLRDYPLSSIKEKMEKTVREVEDIFAENIYKSALYFRKKQNSKSEIMYLKTLLKKYPRSKYAKIARIKVTNSNSDEHKNADIAFEGL